MASPTDTRTGEAVLPTATRSEEVASPTDTRSEEVVLPTDTRTGEAVLPTDARSGEAAGPTGSQSGEFTATGDRRHMGSSIIVPGSLFQEFGMFLTVGVFEVTVLAENQRALVIGEDADAVAVMLLNGGLVELELPQHATERG